MEGGPAILADPTLIARQYRKSLEAYLSELSEAIRGAVIDYHRVTVTEEYEDVLVRFLLARMPKGAR